MKRRQLFEFEDLPWFPAVIREAQIETLNRANRIVGFNRALAPILSRAIAAAGCGEILDLCSGGGSPVLGAMAALVEAGHAPPRVTLSDLYPHPEAWTRLAGPWNGRVRFAAEPVDATNLPDLHGCLVTIFNALHHFPPATVRAFFAEIARRGSALLVVEAFPRSLLRASVYLPALAASVVVNPFLCQRRGLLKALLTLPLPALPLTGLWDWLVSALRIHEPPELLAIARETAPHYRWEIGETPYGWWGRAGHLLGRPPLPRAASGDS
jgi:hypothetical protein